MVVDSTGRQESASNTVRLEALTEVVRDPDEVKKPGKAGASISITGSPQCLYQKRVMSTIYLYCKADA